MAPWEAEPVRCKTRDFFPLASSRTITPEGFLDAPAKIARTGIQVYTARELGLDGGEKRIRLYRSPEEVAKSVKSFEGKTATDDHPPEDVTAANWKTFAVGDVRDTSLDGNFVSARIIVRDEAAKRAVQDGKAELSCGYSFDLDMTPGTSSDGQEFDGWQRNIEGNHVAIVDAGRAGSQVRIADRDPSRRNLMKTRISTKDHKISDKLSIPAHTITLEAEDAVIASVQDLADRHDRAMKDCKDAYDSKSSEVDLHKERADAAEKYIRDMAKEMKASSDDDEEDGDPDDDEVGGQDSKKKTGDRVAKIKAKIAATTAAKDAEIAALKAQTAPEAEEKRAEVRAKVIGDAKPLLGEDFDPKGKTVDQIRLAAVDAALKDESLKGFVTALLGGTELAKAKAEDVAKVLDGIVAMPGRETIGDTQDLDVSRALLGNDSPTTSVGGHGHLYGREAKMARDAARSRRAASGAAGSRRGNDSNSDVNLDA